MSKKQENAKIFLSQHAVIYNENTQKFLILKEKGISGDLGAWQFPGGRILKTTENLKKDLEKKLVKDIGKDISLEFKGMLDKKEFVYYEEDKCDGLILFELAFYKEGDIKLSKKYEEFTWVNLDDLENEEKYGDWVAKILKVATKKISLEQAQNNMLRVLAEFDNYKKQSAQRQSEMAKYAGEKIIHEMLPVLDNFHSATEHVPEDQKDSPWLTGIMYIQRQMEKVFEDEGVVEIDIKVGDEFNPETMEAMVSNNTKKDSEDETKKDNKDVKEENQEQKVSKIIKKGYMMKGKVMRPARVEIG